MSLITRLIARMSEAIGGRNGLDGQEAAQEAAQEGAGSADERLAVAALLVHVARVDGTMSETERDALARLLATRFGVTASGAALLIARADTLDREVDDVAELIEMMGHGVDEQDRRRLLAMASEVAAADGAVGEFETDLVWRLGRLLGIEQPDIHGSGSDGVRGGAVRPA